MINSYFPLVESEADYKKGDLIKWAQNKMIEDDSTSCLKYNALTHPTVLFWG